jgi:hypothetical protein
LLILYGKSPLLCEVVVFLIHFPMSSEERRQRAEQRRGEERRGEERGLVCL